jgi:hypothetical protein
MAARKFTKVSGSVLRNGNGEYQNLYKAAYRVENSTGSYTLSDTAGVVARSVSDAVRKLEPWARAYHRAARVDVLSVELVGRAARVIR